MHKEGRAQNLRDMVEYQEGGIVSKTLVEKEQGTATLFAFDKGEALSEHTAPFDAMVYLLEGNAEVIVSGTPSIVKGGDMIVMPANAPHALRALERFKMLLVMIAG